MGVIENTKTVAKKQIDTSAEFARQQISARSPGQVAVYQEKVEEAIDFSSRGYPLAKVKEYPFIEAEMQALDMSAKDVTDRILKAKSDWIRKAAAIEYVRLGAKAKIDQCQTNQEIQDIVSTTSSKLQTLFTTG